MVINSISKWNIGVYLYSPFVLLNTQRTSENMSVLFFCHIHTLAEEAILGLSFTLAFRLGEVGIEPPTLGVSGRPSLLPEPYPTQVFVGAFTLKGQCLQHMTKH